MLKFKIKNKKESLGITLVALVVTIIVLLILVAVTLNLVLGENGIINLAKRGKLEYGNSIIQEQEEINSLYAQAWENTTIENLPANTADTEAGTLVEIPDKWKETVTANVISTVSGEGVGTKKVASVYAVSDGEANTIPVPIGFYYVGGTVSTGVVISDDIADKYESGIDKVSHAYTTSLVGNQFVWIPCNISSYVKTDFGKSNTNWDRITTSQEEYQVEKYGGFYVGRYEAGLADSGIVDATKKGAVSVTSTTFASWHSDVFNLDGGNLTSSSKASTKAGDIPWYHADYYTAVEMSKRMYKGSTSVTSGLLTGTMWDVMVKYMTTEGEYKGTSGTAWGNYKNQNLTDCTGLYTNVTNGATTAWAQNTAGTNAKRKENNIQYDNVILSTGASASCARKNIYDVSGNLWEWTQESAYRKELTMNNTDKNYNSYVLRGGCFYDAYSSISACFRAGTYSTNTSTYHGFRVALFIK